MTGDFLDHIRAWWPIVVFALNILMMCFIAVMGRFFVSKAAYEKERAADVASASVANEKLAQRVSTWEREVAERLSALERQGDVHQQQMRGLATRDELKVLDAKIDGMAAGVKRIERVVGLLLENELKGTQGGRHVAS